MLKTCQVRAVIDGPLPEEVCTYIIRDLGLNMEKMFKHFGCVMPEV